MRQREKRSSTDAAIRVWHENQGFRATALDISPGGARLRGMASLPMNSWVTVQYLHLNLRARVVWTDRDVFGVSFASRLTITQCKALQDALLHVADRLDEGLP
jgi:hypothetical protein